MRRLFLLLAALLPLLPSCQSTGGADNSPAVQMRNSAILAEPRGDWFIGRRYYTSKVRYWGYLRQPGQLWETARLVVMDEAGGVLTRTGSPKSRPAAAIPTATITITNIASGAITAAGPPTIRTAIASCLFLWPGNTRSSAAIRASCSARATATTRITSRPAKGNTRRRTVSEGRFRRVECAGSPGGFPVSPVPSCTP